MGEDNSASLKFTARLAQVTSELYDLAYVQVDSNLSIVRVSPNLSSVLNNADRVVAGVPLTDALGEFFGVEKTLRSILQNELPSFKLERINRVQPDGSVRYLTFHVLPFDPDQVDSGLLVVVEDVTRFGFFEQNLLQKRNELSLVRGALTMPMPNWINVLSSAPLNWQKRNGKLNSSFIVSRHCEKMTMRYLEQQICVWL